MSKTITIGGKVYRLEEDNYEDNTDFVYNQDGLHYVIVRTYSAGVFAGYIKARNGKEVDLVDARRIWMWVGAASLSELAVNGVSKPKECKFPCEVPEIKLLEAIEIVPVSKKAKKTIDAVPVWTAH